MESQLWWLNDATESSVNFSCGYGTYLRLENSVFKCVCHAIHLCFLLIFVKIHTKYVQTVNAVLSLGWLAASLEPHIII